MTPETKAFIEEVKRRLMEDDHPNWNRVSAGFADKMIKIIESQEKEIERLKWFESRFHFIEEADVGETITLEDMKLVHDGDCELCGAPKFKTKDVVK